MKNKIDQAMLIMQKVGYDEIFSKLKELKESIQADTYKIAVVGEFKAGKSTLINLIFLKDDTLFTDIMEATAVPTKIDYNPNKRLQIIPYDKKSYKAQNPFEENITDGFETPESEGKPIEIINPSTADIKEHTSSDSPEGRTLLARKTARVNLYWPAVNVKGLSLFDTPGINSVNEAVIATTYRIIPEADLVLFLTKAKQLSEIEIRFLCGHVFKQGITRAMVIINYDDRETELSNTERKRLVEAVHGQLSNVGREYVPVEMVNLSRNDNLKSSRKSFMERMAETDIDTSIQSTLDELLGKKRENVTSDDKENDKEITIEAFEKKLMKYILNNVRPGRMEKIEGIFKSQLQIALLKCQTELSAMNKNQKDREQMLNDVKRERSEIAEKQEAMITRLQYRLEAIENELINGAVSGLKDVADAYITGFDECTDLSGLQNRLTNSQATLKGDIEAVFFECSLEAEEKVRGLIQEFGMESDVLFDDWYKQIGATVQIDGGVVARIPPFAVFAIDLFLSIGIGPFGALGDIIIRIIANYIPYLRQILPTNLGGMILRNKVKESLELEFENIEAELPLSIKKQFRRSTEKILEEMQDRVAERLDSIEGSLEKVVNQPFDYDSRNVLQESQKEIETLLGL
jgi:ribosome biogenesis GTPase A